MNLRHSFKWSGIFSGTNIFLRMIEIGLFSLFLTPSEYGIFGILLVIIGFGRIFADIGLGNAIIQAQDLTSDQFASIFWLNLALGLVVAVVFFFAAPFLAGFYNESILSNLIKIVSVIFVLEPVTGLFNAWERKKLNFKHITLLETSSRVCGTIGSVFFLFMQFGVYALIFGQLIATSIKLILFLFYNENYRKIKLVLDIKGSVSLLSFGLYQFGDKLLNYVAQYFDYFLIGKFLGSAELGYYSFAYQIIITPVTQINPVFNRVLFPAFSILSVDRNKLKDKFGKLLSYISAVNLPVYIVIAVFSQLLLPLYAGGKWIPSIILIQVLSLAGISRAFTNPSGSLILSVGKARTGFYWNLFQAVIQIPVLFIGIKFGAIGVAASFSIAQFFFFLFNHHFLVKQCVSLSFWEYMKIFKTSLISGALSTLTVIFLIAILHINIITMSMIIVTHLLIYGAVIFYLDRDIQLLIRKFIRI